MSETIAFVSIGTVIETAVLGLLVYRRIWSKLPFFFVYCIWALASDAASLGVQLLTPGGYGIRFYTIESTLDFSFQFCVLVELAWSVLGPLRPYLSRRALAVIATAILAAGAVIWPFAGISGAGIPTGIWHIMAQLQQTVSILRVLVFVSLASSSQVLSLGWRDRELQVATGFGFYSLVSLAVAAVNAHQANSVQFVDHYRLVAGAFLCTLCYWVYSFSRRDTAP